MLLEKLKLSKPLVRSMTDAGFLDAKEIQAKTMSRIIGGQDIIAVGPEGSGKTTAYVLGVLMRLKYGFEEAPRALILVPDKERVQAVIDQFNLLNKNQTIRIVGLYATPGIEAQMDALADGADIVVATPDRARAIYLKLGLNLNKIMMFIVDDAHLIVKQGLQLPVAELARSITRCQHLVFTEVLHNRLNLMIDPFMNFPAQIEVEHAGKDSMETYPQSLYLVPNFRTKINLLNLVLEDITDQKVLIFVNTRLTAQKLYQSLTPVHARQAAVLNPLFFDQAGFDSIEEFKADPEIKILIAANESAESFSSSGIDTLIHFELPPEKETLISRIVKNHEQETGHLSGIIFSTDLELDSVKKIELAIGLTIPVISNPESLVIYDENKQKAKKKDTQTVKQIADEPGPAFHEKKASNVKNYNYGSGEKAKMNRKKKHS